MKDMKNKTKNQTYLIKSSEIKETFHMKEAMSAVEKAFGLYEKGKIQMPAKNYLYFEKGDLRCMPAYLPYLKIGGVKNVTVHPGNKQFPTVMATIILIDPETGFPLAIMDGTHITALRTGAAGGVAVKYLARANSKVLALIGSGRQAATQLQAIMIVKPDIERVYVYDLNMKSAKQFSKKYSKEYHIKVIAVTSVKQATASADIVVTTTPSRTPLVKGEYIKEGTHINAIGADAKGKQELESSLLKKAKIIIDDWHQASSGGEINIPLSKGIITKKDIYGELGEVVLSKKKRKDDKEITIFDSTGLAIQDIVCAATAYKKIIANKKIEKYLQKIAF